MALVLSMDPTGDKSWVTDKSAGQSRKPRSMTIIVNTNFKMHIWIHNYLLSTEDFDMAKAFSFNMD